MTNSSASSSSFTAAVATASLTTNVTTTLDAKDQLLSLLRIELSYAPSSTHHPGGDGELSSSFGDTICLYSEREEEEEEFEFFGGSSSSSSSCEPIPRSEWRARIADWCYRVADRFQYDREIVYMSMNCLDRYLIAKRRSERVARRRSTRRVGSAGGGGDSSSSVEYDDRDSGDDEDGEIDVGTYHMAAMTALYMCVKVHGRQPEEDEDYNDDGDGAVGANDAGDWMRTDALKASGLTSPGAPLMTNWNAAPAMVLRRQHERQKRKKRMAPPRLNMTSFVDLSKGQFSKGDIGRMEGDMLRTIRWRVNPPTPMAFVSQLMRLFPTSPAAETASLSLPPTVLLSSSLRQRRKQRGGRTRERQRERQRRHDLSLHVLHELSRYLTELTVCLPDVANNCGSFRPSSISFAAILVGMDVLCEDEALDRPSRREFLREAREICPFRLRTDDVRVLSLKDRMRTTFLDQLLRSGGGDGDGGGCRDDNATGGDATVADEHPIAVARAAGLLSRHLMAGGGSGSEKRGSPSSWTTSSSGGERSSSSSARCVTPEQHSGGDDIGRRGEERKGAAVGMVKKCKLLRRTSPSSVVAIGGGGF